MADLNKIVDDLSSLTVLEAAELSKLLEEKWGVSAAAPVAVAATFPFVLKGEAEVDAVIGGRHSAAAFCSRVVNDWAERGAEVPRCVEGVVSVKCGVGLARAGAAAISVVRRRRRGGQTHGRGARPCGHIQVVV